jgi:RNA recognition motif-containing protein
VPKTGEARPATSKRAIAERRDVVEDSPSPEARLWFANLRFDVNEELLSKFVSQFATIENIYLPRIAGGRSKGYAFIEFSSPDVASEVLPKLNGEIFGGRRLVVRRATPRAR